MRPKGAMELKEVGNKPDEEDKRRMASLMSQGCYAKLRAPPYANGGYLGGGGALSLVFLSIFIIFLLGI